METLLTKENLEWLLKEASVPQGCLPPDECDSNREFIARMRVELLELVKRDQSKPKRSNRRKIIRPSVTGD